MIVRRISRALLAIATAGLILRGGGREVTAQIATKEIPKFLVQPGWPTIPNGWTLGQVSDATVDKDNNIWIIQRPRTVKTGVKTGPPVMEFDQVGHYIKGWGGPGQGYPWPQVEHGIYIDYRGYVWICGSGNNDQVYKFTQNGKFLMQIGHATEEKSNHDTAQFFRPTAMSVYPPTNELFVSDGYANRRIIVFDADTGKFKRMWGAFGHAPDGPPPAPERSPTTPDPNRTLATEFDPKDPGPPQFDTVHDVAISKDGLVYVGDRGGKRVQVFKADGTYIAQVWIDRWCLQVTRTCGNGQTAGSVAFSADRQQRFLYVGSRSPARVLVFDRKTLKMITSFGRAGIGPAEFDDLHEITTDSSGNLYVCEVEDGRRIQRFVFKGIVTVPAGQNEELVVK